MIAVRLRRKTGGLLLLIAAFAAGSCFVAPAVLEQDQGQWKAVALFNAACWGSSYISSQAGIDAMSSAGVEDAAIVFGACRFALAALPLLPWILKSSCSESARGSALVGTLSAVAYAAVFASISHGTSGAKAAFIMALQTIIVAFCSSLAANRFQLGSIASAVLALCGIGLLELGGGAEAAGSASEGDMLCMAAPLLMGLSWHVLGNHMRQYPQDATPAVAIQLACFAFVFVCWTVLEQMSLHGLEGVALLAHRVPQLLEVPNLVPALLFSAFLGNTVTYLLCNCTMKHLKADEVSLLSASEPLWAALVASLMLHQSLAPSELMGGALVVAGIVAAELWSESEPESGTLKNLSAV
ncbi:unnamed protein product [Effrenium voratum]|uniref:EamA domain-containing protein n=1 Tax=Effrenium voratum TaxID=2562239 RepID=A0AA36JD49_9DINO|nr:unnamed protein product [Effrenium voratum]CAJ1402894.1 unnamed protein product [Effrenium voratum]CAJ1431529.1 unnamed protein product [Effrenium voratum]CAJ1448746.1 unnamed protein product [Effrenium voratum]|mmetsp:Transcript_30091/g.71639  ORF Transcript_30091/g.71639 Transcript_30091/m.71639 type:complete len:355 (-) Transcript_30091:38-1102(-)|eukprot:CAMPEP_0181508460 /NCGR_PEP_ID=MMETSP1110-20121109/59749_1 /TAXON_ID=174948 /ORGANISM="Symbiodinium sp., Strain CCMP421" /LENGTH=354 /DNA_ID=CAMNT_0023637805 /DNA_START=1 /DNA_END=1065 /DNA_ORIENTATION=-